MTPYGDHVVEVLEKAAGSVLCRSPVTPLKRAGNVAKLTVEAAIWDALVIRITDPIGRSATSSPIAVI